MSPLFARRGDALAVKILVGYLFVNCRAAVAYPQKKIVHALFRQLRHILADRGKPGVEKTDVADSVEADVRIDKARDKVSVGEVEF